MPNQDSLDRESTSSGLSEASPKWIGPDGPASLESQQPQSDAGPVPPASVSQSETEPATAPAPPEEDQLTRLERGAQVIANAVKTLPGAPGVYRMLSEEGDALYVGKAKNLKKRVNSYTGVGKLPYRLKRMVSETVSMEFVTTHTEVEALLLESNLIKRLMPRYNVLLRDDKSFPYILVTGDKETAQITKHRGAQNRDGDYFGPFADATAVNMTITALEKAFLLRSCSDGVFNNRKRPCLLYQIKRCSAPCVDRISPEAYSELVEQARAFLSGRSQRVQQDLVRQMEAASEAMDFEVAAEYRDRIRALAHIQSRQDVNVAGIDNADIFAAHADAGQICIQVFFFRAGRNYGNRAYFPSHDKTLEIDSVLSSFLSQFYDNKPIPKLILTSHKPADLDLLSEALSFRSEHRVEIATPQRGDKRKIIENALQNARQALARRLAESSSQRRLLEGLAEALGLDSAPERIEVYDNSHIQGSNAYGGMIVAGLDGFLKSSYRKFAIRGAVNSPTREKPDQAVDGAAANDEAFTPGDDYAMMREVLHRRLSRALKEDPERRSGQWPDLILLDGGKGQLTVGLEVLEELGIDDLAIAAVAKGPDRNAGRERIFVPDKPSFMLGPRDPVLYFIQRLRDEAHRFAIETHRKGRSKSRLRSVLDDVPGIGAKRKKALLLHFGSAGAVSRAGLSDLEGVEGINKAVARKIYDHFNTLG
ncbi:excinuclease ABC subunit UvrC [Denitrobaculum tricleocarpae]|uniref:UvrABC system protein C n=2 Tax=Denitrobaculum tricleocarpae TaxID=2591009 RepID=A0A545U394_9PROT|nr:excinuclease ABC subunit UvrC [Denitrobaculum tricleocarpae]